MFFYTADEHYNHANIIKFCNRPFSNVREMNETLIKNHNEVVGESDIVVHVGDFSMGSRGWTMERVFKQLKGTHIFIRGSHDRWLGKSPKSEGNFQFVGYIYEKTFKDEGILIVACHYAMRTWRRSHWNSWHVYGHSHSRLPSIGKSMDVGVDTNNYYPYSLDQIKEIMVNKPDNPNFISKSKKKSDER